MSRLAGRIAVIVKLGVSTILRWLWILNSRWGATVSLPRHDKVTVILLAYHEKRMRNIQPLVRSALKCTFVEKVIVSNNNPRLHIRDWVQCESPRVILIDQPVSRGTGYRWNLIQSDSSDYFLAIDDDVLLFPGQMARLIRQLAAQPEVPHGLAGHSPAGYIQSRETEVDSLFQVYAVTQRHVKIYFEHLQAIRALDPLAADSVEILGDYLVISSVSPRRPMIHAVGLILRCPTASQQGVAIHTRSDFQTRLAAIKNCLRQLGQLNKN
jgi:glycosyltransferase involved in cell wall biosynthesis